MSAWVDVLSWVCLVAGGTFCMVGALGLLRMPDFYTRMHAASVIDTLGAGLVLLGLLLQSGLTLVAVKLLMVGLLIFFASPTASHALARAALARGLKPMLDDDKTTPASAPAPTPNLPASGDTTASASETATPPTEVQPSKP